jgi:hypothetical protein
MREQEKSRRGGGAGRSGEEKYEEEEEVEKCMGERRGAAGAGAAAGGAAGGGVRALVGHTMPTRTFIPRTDTNSTIEAGKQRLRLAMLAWEAGTMLLLLLLLLLLLHPRTDTAGTEMARAQSRDTD